MQAVITTEKARLCRRNSFLSMDAVEETKFRTSDFPWELLDLRLHPLGAVFKIQIP